MIQLKSRKYWGRYSLRTKMLRREGGEEGSNVIPYSKNYVLGKTLFGIQIGEDCDSMEK